jgi:hypothetical protein
METPLELLLKTLQQALKCREGLCARIYFALKMKTVAPLNAARPSSSKASTTSCPCCKDKDRVRTWPPLGVVP